MIQLLVSLIEWFAVAGLSVLGIAYSPPQPCSTSEPTEFRQVISWHPELAADKSMGTRVSSGDCLAGSEVLIRNASPVFVTPSDHYDS
ncbi:hypothetical protein [Maricaulis sp.]|uniref:hypothetical protein n=1 Tax=Maricaulis sp. TaxID=1486257 RepID=UPI003A9462C4